MKQLMRRVLEVSHTDRAKKDSPLLLLMIQQIFLLYHLHQAIGLNAIQVVYPIVEVSNPIDYLMIPDHPAPDLLVVLFPALKFNDMTHLSFI